MVWNALPQRDYYIGALSGHLTDFEVQSGIFNFAKGTKNQSKWKITILHFSSRRQSIAIHQTAVMSPHLLNERGRQNQAGLKSFHAEDACIK